MAYKPRSNARRLISKLSSEGKVVVLDPDCVYPTSMRAHRIQPCSAFLIVSMFCSSFHCVRSDMATPTGFGTLNAPPSG